MIDLWNTIDVCLVRAFISILPKKWKYIESTNGNLWNKKHASTMGIL